MQIDRIEAIPALPKRKRVAAYARVSCGKETMLHSLAAQVEYYTGLIGRNPDWEFAGVYSDEALTGTKDNRPEFQRLLADCRAGNIDMVITKSVSRMARNTVTVLASVRELKSLKVVVFFEEEHIHSDSGDGELLLTILSSYAQEQSRSCSENNKWRIRSDFQKGRPNTGKMLGYRLVKGKLTVVPEETALVRAIYDDFLSGMGIEAIRKKLRAEGISFSKGGISSILRNEKYAGDLLLQKTFVQDHLTKKGRKNRGELPQYYVAGSHEAIIQKETFEAVQAEIARRAEKHTVGAGIFKPPEVYPFTGLIRCGKCGAPYRRKHAAAGTKYEKIVLICTTFNSLGKAECDSQQIPEDILERLVVEFGGTERISEILVPEANQLVFHLKSGQTVLREWQNPSRRQSWTPEMREAARQQSLERSARKRNATERNDHSSDHHAAETKHI